MGTSGCSGRVREEKKRPHSRTARGCAEFGFDSQGEPGDGFQQGRDMACILKSSLLWLDSPTRESERGDRRGAMHSLSTGRPVRPDGSRDPQRPTHPGKPPTTPARVGAVSP